LERGFQQANRNAQSYASATESTLVIGNGPGVALHLLEDVGDLELGLLNGQKEARSRGEGRALRLLRRHAGAHALNKAQHLLNLLGSVVLVAAEDI
jgi:hypothetical protein